MSQSVSDQTKLKTLFIDKPFVARVVCGATVRGTATFFASMHLVLVVTVSRLAPGVTGPDNDQEQTTTTLFGRSLVLKFQDQTTTT